MTQKGKLYMVPTSLGDSDLNNIIPEGVKNIIGNLRQLIVEDVRTTRRYLSKLGFSSHIDETQFYVLNKHTKPQEIHSFLEPLLRGEDMGIISEAGTPGVADPGADVVKIAHEKGIRIIPLVGPSSILLSVMASGMNGQSFAFNGYLPIKKPDKVKQIKFLETRSAREKQTQLFIEAPYRNQAMLEDIIQACSDNTQLCIACDITLETEYIETKSIKAWRKNIPDIKKRPAIFLIQA